jgi:CubicO group peptidase (beta-lactamase class C family)
MAVLLNRREFLGLSGGALAGGAPDAWPEWAKGIPPLMDETNVPGLSIAIVEGGKLVWRKGFGVKDLASKAPVEDGTMFEAASMSKPVFAYAVMKLCEKGILNLDTPLTKYTPDRFLKDDPRLDRITARHVLSHTSGFQNTRSGKEPLKIHFAPGEKWMYSGEGFAYLQSVVTHLTGRVDPKPCAKYEADLEVCSTDFDAYMKTNLLAPFGMNSSGYLWADSFAKKMARPHNAQGTPMDNKRSAGPDVARYGAMGALLTNATDYAKFLIEVIDPKSSDKFRLNAASHTEMLRPQIKVTDGDGYSIWWSLGWRIAKTAEGDFASHGGDNTGFHSTAEVCLKDKSGFVILTNGDGGVELIKRLAPEVSRKLHKD